MSITGSTDLGDGRLILTVDHDPRTTVTDAPAGSIIVYVGSPSGDFWTGCRCIKLDDGSTTNVHYVGGRPTLTGSQDILASTPYNLDISAARKIKHIARARFWISEWGVDVGLNTATRIQLKFFNTDAFSHAEFDSVGEVGLSEQLIENQFVSQDLAAVVNNGAGSIEVDSAALFLVDYLVRIHDGTKWEFQRIDSKPGGGTLGLYDTILRADGDPVWSIDEDVTRVLELRDVECSDEDYSDEIHLRLIPNASDDDCRFHYWIEYEGEA